MSDDKIVEIDIDVFEAHNIMLYEQGIISEDDLKEILAGFESARLAWKLSEGLSLKHRWWMLRLFGKYVNIPSERVTKILEKLKPS